MLEHEGGGFSYGRKVIVGRHRTIESIELGHYRFPPPPLRLVVLAGKKKSLA